MDPIESIIIIVSIILLMLYTISLINKEKMALLEKFQKYESAIQIYTEDMFQNSIEAEIGNAFVYGNLIAIDTVSFEELKEQYSYVLREEQLYCRHERQVTVEHKNKDGSIYTTTESEEFWTWDTVKMKKKCSTKISFLDVEFNYEQIKFPNPQYIKTVDIDTDSRYVYYGTGWNYTGTLYTVLKNGTINNSQFFQKTIDETIKDYEGDAIIFYVVKVVGKMFLFWIVLLIVICCLIEMFF